MANPRGIRYRPPPEARFWPNVDKNGPVPDYAPDLGPRWVWLAARNARGGYGVFGLNRKQVLAHRFAYSVVVGPIPDGLHLDHLCRVRHCVRPDHLEPVTPRINLLRGIGFAAENARKTHCKRGHEFTEENTYRKNGSRECRTCMAAMWVASEERKKARRKAAREARDA